MRAYSEADFCEPNLGVKYIFAKMGIIYGTMFRTHWGDMDKQSVIDTWVDILGRYATYKPSMDFAIQHMDTKFIPSALAFRELCTQAGRIPDKPHSIITKQPTQDELSVTAKAKEEALRAIRQFTQSVRVGA